MQFENSESGLREIKTGIPQGSILGPLFFSIVIIDIVNSSTTFRFLMYADDTTIYFFLRKCAQNTMCSKFHKGYGPIALNLVHKNILYIIILYIYLFIYKMNKVFLDKISPKYISKLIKWHYFRTGEHDPQISLAND